MQELLWDCPNEAIDFLKRKKDLVKEHVNDKEFFQRMSSYIHRHWFVKFTTQELQYIYDNLDIGIKATPKT